MERKTNYINTFINLTEEYKKIMISECLNVGSSQIQKIRKALRGKAVVLMGKNTMMKKAVEMNKDNNPVLVALKPYLKNKICLVFTNGDLKEIREIINDNRVSAPAKAGQVSKVTVTIPAQNTGMEPTVTSFFQALDIPTRITKGTVEIISDFNILVVGQKVGNSEAMLLTKLNMQPFSYGFVLETIYDNGAIYSPDVLDLSASILSGLLGEALKNVAGISLATNYSTAASVQSELISALKDSLALSVEANYSCDENSKVLEYLADPSKFAVATVAPVQSNNTKNTTTATATVVDEPAKSESDGEGFGLFGDESD
jgi:large subunit ribosomal protein LP0